VKPLTRGLLHPDPRSVCPLSSAEFVEPSPRKKILGTLLLTVVRNHNVGLVRTLYSLVQVMNILEEHSILPGHQKMKAVSPDQQLSTHPHIIRSNNREEPNFESSCSAFSMCCTATVFITKATKYMYQAVNMPHYFYV
jgi:hypothetical protein